MESTANKRKNKEKAVHSSSPGPAKRPSCTGEAKVPKSIFRSSLSFIGVPFAIVSLLLSIYIYLDLGRDNGSFWFGNYLTHFYNVRKERVGKARGYENDSIWDLHHRSSLSLSEFIEKYDGKRPVIITDALQGWKALNWNKEFFVKNYGDQRVVMKAVAGTLEQAESMALPVSLFGQHSNNGKPTSWTYLQDELFIQLHPELRGHLGEPIYLKEDFFQLFPAELRPWNAMLLWGTAYSRSYLHIDPYNWTGTNAVFSGKKLWKVYPPGQDRYLYVKQNIASGFPLNCFKYNSPVDAFNPDLKKYPLFSKAKAISFAQNPGELFIIPPGWFHQAFNEMETIAVSSQVMNTQNYNIILEEIFKLDNIDTSKLPKDFENLSPKDQVQTVVKLLPQRIITRGRKVTEDILKQMGYPI